MIKVTPPNDTTFYNGAKVSAEGIEVTKETADVLIARGWKQTTQPLPKPQKQKPPVKTDEKKEE